MLLRFALSLLALALPLFSAKTFAQDSRSHSSHASHPAYAETLHLHGISDVGKINDYLYRGSQPNDEGLRELKKLGITMIIDLRGERKGLAKSERKKAQALGIRVVNIPASGWSTPKDKDLVRFLFAHSAASQGKNLRSLLARWRSLRRVFSRLPHRDRSLDGSASPCGNALFPFQIFLASPHEKIRSEFPGALRQVEGFRGTAQPGSCISTITCSATLYYIPVAQAVRVCVATHVSGRILRRCVFLLGFRRSRFLPDSLLGAACPLRFLTKAAVTGQVVRDRRQRPFHCGCRLAAALELPHPTLFFQSSDHRLDHPLAFPVPSTPPGGSQPLTATL